MAKKKKAAKKAAPKKKAAKKTAPKKKAAPKKPAPKKAAPKRSTKKGGPGAFMENIREENGIPVCKSGHGNLGGCMSVGEATKIIKDHEKNFPSHEVDIENC